MNTAVILELLDLEISRLQQAKVLLQGVKVKNGRGRPRTNGVVLKPLAATPAKRILSAEAKKRIADGQKKRWAKAKRVANKAAKVVAVKTLVKVLKPAPAKTVKKAVPATKTVPEVKS